MTPMQQSGVALLMMSLLPALICGLACDVTGGRTGPVPTPTLSATSVETDRAALMALFNGTNGEEWREKGNWGRNDMRLSEWDGVTTIGDLMGRGWEGGKMCYEADHIPSGLVPREKSRRHEYCERGNGIVPCR